MNDENYNCEGCGAELTREEYEAGGGYCDLCDYIDFIEE
jgi:hypothetical protein